MFQEMGSRHTTAVDDIDKKEPTKTPSDNLPPHNCKANFQKFSIHYNTIVLKTMSLAKVSPIPWQEFRRGT